MIPEPPPVMHREAGPCQRRPDFARALVVAVRFAEARRAEHRHAGTVEGEALEAAQELEEESHGALEVGLARATAGEKGLLGLLEVREQRSALRWGAAWAYSCRVRVGLVRAATMPPAQRQINDYRETTT
jgi:hypothetical protein